MHKIIQTSAAITIATKVNYKPCIHQYMELNMCQNSVDEIQCSCQFSVEYLVHEFIFISAWKFSRWNSVCRIQCTEFSARNLVHGIQCTEFSARNSVHEIQCMEFSPWNSAGRIQCMGFRAWNSAGGIQSVKCMKFSAWSIGMLIIITFGP